MVRSTTVVTIFLASPTDVGHERDVVVRFVSDWNEINGRGRSVAFELLRWETTVSAGFGSDGQDVVNRQIDGDYDVLIALFWARLGTPTPRAISGTAEEYERALHRFKQGENLEIAFYFKDSFVDSRAIDLGQLASVRDFERTVQGAGAFSKSFRDDDSLRFELGILLDRMARRFGGVQPSRSSDERVNAASAGNNVVKPDDGKLEDHCDSNVIAAENNEDEPGLFDIMDSLDKHTNDASAFLREMTERLSRLSENTNEINRRFEDIGRSRPLETNDVRPFIPQIADGMNSYSDFLESELSLFAENSSAMAQDVRKLIDVSQDFSTSISELHQLRDTLVTLVDGMGSLVQSSQGLLGSTAGMQRTTSVFNRAKRRLVRNLELLIANINNGKSLMEQAIAELSVLIG